MREVLAALFLFSASSSAQAATVTHVVITVPKDGDLVKPPVDHDTWTSKQIDFPEQILNKGDKLVLDINFPDGDAIWVKDNWLSSDESIYFLIGGSGGVGGGPAHELDFEFQFTGVKGDLPVNPIKGKGILAGASGNGLSAIGLSGGLASHFSTELTNGTFSFRDITLTVTVPGTIAAGWSPTWVKVGVDADQVSLAPIPLPSSGLLLGMGVLTIWLRRKG